ncbi:hypothetical protein ABZ725_51215 [Streptomyces sp. NPDC006872]
MSRSRSRSAKDSAVSRSAALAASLMTAVVFTEVAIAFCMVSPLQGWG